MPLFESQKTMLIFLFVLCMSTSVGLFMTSALIVYDHQPNCLYIYCLWVRTF